MLLVVCWFFVWSFSWIYPPNLMGGGRLHCKKGLEVFPSPAGMSLTKLSLAGNNLPSPSPRKVWSIQIQESRGFIYSVTYNYGQYSRIPCPIPKGGVPYLQALTLIPIFTVFLSPGCKFHIFAFLAMDYTVKKRLAIFPSPAGMSLTKLSLAGNDLPIPSSWKVWSKEIQESRKFLLQCMHCGTISSICITICFTFHARLLFSVPSTCVPELIGPSHAGSSLRSRALCSSWRTLKQGQISRSISTQKTPRNFLPHRLY